MDVVFVNFSSYLWTQTLEVETVITQKNVDWCDFYLLSAYLSFNVLDLCWGQTVCFGQHRHNVDLLM